MKPHIKLRLVRAEQRPLAALTMAEERAEIKRQQDELAKAVAEQARIAAEAIAKIEAAAVRRDFGADPWIVGEGPKFFTPDRVAQMAFENEKLRKERK